MTQKKILIKTIAIKKSNFRLGGNAHGNRDAQRRLVQKSFKMRALLPRRA
jgi:hypothetical protein